MEPILSPPGKGGNRRSPCLPGHGRLRTSRDSPFPGPGSRSCENAAVGLGRDNPGIGWPPGTAGRPGSRRARAASRMRAGKPIIGFRALVEGRIGEDADRTPLPRLPSDRCTGCVRAARPRRNSAARRRWRWRWNRRRARPWLQGGKPPGKARRCRSRDPAPRCPPGGRCRASRAVPGSVAR